MERSFHGESFSEKGAGAGKARARAERGAERTVLISVRSVSFRAPECNGFSRARIREAEIPKSRHRNLGISDSRGGFSGAAAPPVGISRKAADIPARDSQNPRFREPGTGISGSRILGFSQRFLRGGCVATGISQRGRAGVVSKFAFYKFGDNFLASRSKIW